MIRKPIVVLSVIIVATTALAEQTVGLFLNDERAFEGYTLFAPCSWYTTYLIDNQGLEVNSWESEYVPGAGGMAYLSEDGYLFRSIWLGEHPVFGGGCTGGIQKLDWDGNVVWYFEYRTNNYSPHHDIEVLPNGNVLLIVSEVKSHLDAIQAGVDTTKLQGQGLYTETIIEVEPVGTDSGNIVWEWHAWDHLVQDFNPSVDNYKSIAAHPELIDINARNFLFSDFIHFNGVDYNPEFDQIMLTTRMYNEIWVIDHTTTTEEAAGHTGGNYGKGGDILYRWGNPRFYDQGEVEDQMLFAPHDGNWITSGCPGEGNILVFNNGSFMFRTYSSVDEFIPPVDEQGNYSGFLPWDPDEILWTYTAANPYDLFALIISGAQRQPNGNTLICNGPDGEFFEVTPANDIVWRYVNPASDNGPVFQGDSITNNLIFKIRRYAPDFPGFVDKDLTPGKPVELYPDDTTETVTEIKKTSITGLRLNPAVFNHSTVISYQIEEEGRISVKLYNSLGREVRTLIDEIVSAGSGELVWDGTDELGRRLSPGVYFCKLTTASACIKQKIVLVM